MFRALERIVGGGHDDPITPTPRLHRRSLSRSLLAPGRWPATCASTDARPAAARRRPPRRGHRGPQPGAAVARQSGKTAVRGRHPGQQRPLLRHLPRAGRGHHPAPGQRDRAPGAPTPQDPLFNRLDADDPQAAVLTLRAPEEGPGPRGAAAARQHGRHRRRRQGDHPARPHDLRVAGVPTVANTALTAPYQFDGREPTLQQQAAERGHQPQRGPQGRCRRPRWIGWPRFQNAASSPRSAPGSCRCCSTSACRGEASPSPRSSCR